MTEPALNIVYLYIGNGILGIPPIRVEYADIRSDLADQVIVAMAQAVADTMGESVRINTPGGGGRATISPSAVQ